MAKMVVMNEINKRTNSLLEQLEVSEGDVTDIEKLTTKGSYLPSFCQLKF